MAWSLQYASSSGRPTILALGNNQADSAIIWVGNALNDDIEAPTDPDIPLARRVELEAAIIAERYGGKWVENPDGPDDSPNKPCEPGEKIPTEGFGIPVIEKGRELGSVIDRWSSALRKAGKWGEERVLNDGTRLADLWKVLGSEQEVPRDLAGLKVAYKVAACEIRTRIQSLEEAK